MVILVITIISAVILTISGTILIVEKRFKRPHLRAYVYGVACEVVCETCMFFGILIGVLLRQCFWVLCFCPNPSPKSTAPRPDPRVSTILRAYEVLVQAKRCLQRDRDSGWAAVEEEWWRVTLQKTGQNEEEESEGDRAARIWASKLEAEFNVKKRLDTIILLDLDGLVKEEREWLQYLERWEIESYDGY